MLIVILGRDLDVATLGLNLGSESQTHGCAQLSDGDTVLKRLSMSERMLEQVMHYGYGVHNAIPGGERGGIIGAGACFRMEWLVGSVEAGWGRCGGCWKISPHLFSGRWGDTDRLVVCSGHY